jgi:hypothetical protein
MIERIKRRIHATIIIIWLWCNLTALRRRWIDASPEERDALAYYAGMLVVVLILILWATTNGK